MRIFAGASTEALAPAWFGRKEIPIMRSLALYGVLLCASAASAQTVQFIRLGHLPGPYPHSTAVDVSVNGQFVAGTSRSHVGFAGEAYRWDNEVGMVGLGLLPGHNQSHAGAISPEGDWVVGHSVMSPEHWEAFAWSANGGIVGLGDLPGGRHYSVARGVSRDGHLVVGNGTIDAQGWNSETSEAFRWTPQDGMVGLGTISPGSLKPSSTANDVSADGRVIVGYSTSAEGGQAFRWTADEGMVGLGAIDPDRFSSGASAVSSNGLWTVGTSRTGLGDGNGSATQAVLWSPEGAITGLGWLQDSGLRYSFAYDVSNDGSRVVGRAGGVGMPDTAFLWTREDGMRALSEVLLTDYGIDLAALGWRLGPASAISPDGLTIVGTGANPDGRGEAWMIRLPAPATLTPLAAAALLAARRRR